MYNLLFTVPHLMIEKFHVYSNKSMFCCCNLYRVGTKGIRRDPNKVRRKWAYLKTAINAKNYEIQHPPTGGGTPKKLTKIEREIIEYLLAKKSVKIEGIPGGMESMVIYFKMCHMFISLFTLQSCMHCEMTPSNFH